MDNRTADYYELNSNEIGKRYESVNSPNLGLFRSFYTKGDAVLDVGCGSGRDLAALLELGIEGYGLEPSAGLRNQAVHYHPELAGRIFKGSLPDDASAVEGKQFDGVVLSAMVMHIEDSQLFSFAFTCRSLIKEEGRLILSHCTQRTGLDVEGRDSEGRLFRLRSSSQLRLLFEELGFRLTAQFSTADSLNRDDVEWETLVFIYNGDARSESVDRIESIINNDRKYATYKLALLRAICEIAQKEPLRANWTRSGKVRIPISHIAEKWISYYLPIIGHNEFIPQHRGESENDDKPVAFRALLQEFSTFFPGTPEGLADYHSRRIATGRKSGLTKAEKSLHGKLLTKIRSTIIQGPVTHTSGNTFEYIKGKKLIEFSGELWREFILLGHWIEDSLLIKWAKLTEEFKNGITAAQVLGLLLMQPEHERFVGSARSVYNKVPDPFCVWSNKKLTAKSMHIDHAIPFAIRHDNSLWNLLPAHCKVNSDKSDKLPTSYLLTRQKDAIIQYWQTLFKENKRLFTSDASRFVGRKELPDYNWETVLFDTFFETVETTAARRGIVRWEV